jgi:alpha-L-rhamnosidase
VFVGGGVKVWNSTLLTSLTCLFVLTIAASAAPAALKPIHLTCDSLVEPLGIDDEKPQFSWQLQDARDGAHQTDYRVEVASKPSLLAAGKADVWDSGRVSSDRSVGVVYAGSALTAEKRYFWRVTVWDKDGNAYPVSDATWWETGLMSARSWEGKWIGYEAPEERSIRESGAVWITNADGEIPTRGDRTRHDFRFGFELSKPVKQATLYLTGRYTAAAWVNGKQVLEASPLPPWGHMPWEKYTKQVVTSEMQPGRNLLAVEVVLYGTGPDGAISPKDVQSPMSACLYVEYADDTVGVFKSGEGWKAKLESSGDWQSPGYDDGSWQAAISYVSSDGPDADSSPGNPWPTGYVKLLRRSFSVNRPIASARLYVTALGAYQMSVNGHRAGDQVLSPGWMDFREQVPYQVYDVTAFIKPGENAMGAWLAPGWYTTPLRWLGRGYNYGDTPPALKAQLRIEHTDGSIEWIATDTTWKADVSPISKAEIYDGESYDARREQAGWDRASFAEGAWKPAVENKARRAEDRGAVFLSNSRGQDAACEDCDEPQARSLHLRLWSKSSRCG